MDLEARGCMKTKDWKKAAFLLNDFLSENGDPQGGGVLRALLDRSRCNYELHNYGVAIEDCQRVIESAGKSEELFGYHARKTLVQCYARVQKLSEAERETRDWLSLVRASDAPDPDLTARLEDVLDCFVVGPLSEQRLNVCMTLAGNRLAPVGARMSTHAVGAKTDGPVCCVYCNVTFVEKAELRAHCQTQVHELMIMSDEGRDWHCRPPPRGFNFDAYQLCENWAETNSCRYGIQCTQAHGNSELIEWHERFQYRQMKIQRAREKELFGKSYTEELLEKWMQSPNPNSLMCDKIDEVEDACPSPLNVTVSSKNGLHEWNFSIQTKKPLKAIALLQDTHRNHFSIASISVKNCQIDLKNDQEWISPLTHQESYFPVEYKVKVAFSTTIFGTFRQSVVFDFTSEPVLVKNLRVDVVPEGDLEKINEIRREITLSLSERWTSQNCDLVCFSAANVDEWERKLRAAYPCPQEETFIISPDTIREKKFTRYNYRERMHELLFLEEMARFDLIKTYNMVVRMQVGSSYVLAPNSMATTTAKYASKGELYAKLDFCRELSEDTSEGRLILKHCNAVYISPSKFDTTKKRKVYETYIEDKGKNTVYLRLSEQTVKELTLNSHSEVEVNAQFQLNRLPYCEWHYTLDKMANFKLIFPETYLEPTIPWSPNRQWSKSLDAKLNTKQKEAVLAITTPLNVQLPPILVIGPFGTGKTYTLAQAVKELIKDASNKILLCTHSNSAADLYIKDYFDKWVMEGNENARPLRIYYSKRWVSTVTPVVQKYCLIDERSSSRTFRPPTVDDIFKHQIVVVTLSTSIYLSSMGLPQGYFTHILLDEAAQAIECETITPLTIASDSTRVVLAGDHMQLGPDIFSPFVKERNLHISLLERLYDHYPPKFPCKILLCENYRAHESIIQFTSESFYDQKLVSSSKQPRHGKFYPLTFFTTRGEDVQERNSTAFYNNSEVYEVAERVEELKKSWPEDWGPFNEQSIGVVTPYSDQVFRIRTELRRRKIDNICVERVLNVQGKQFRAIILSTVRTRTTCKDDDSLVDILDYGFLSNSKLLNTAITRAQSLVAVVGDPIALCSLGRCSKVWERFVQVCNENGSLFGITWHQLKFQLHGIELKKIYNLNPLAPEFIPRSYRQQLMNNILGFDGYHVNNVAQNNMPIPNGINIPQSIPSSVPLNPNIGAAVNMPVNIANGVNIQPNIIQPNNVIKPIVPQVPQYSYQERFFPPPVILQPPQRPILFNLQQPLPNIVPPLPNGFTQPLGVINPQIVVPQRPVQSIPQVPLAKTIPMANITVAPPKLSPYIQNKQPQPPSNNKLIQFMNNVHFPQANTNVLSDCINLLPQNMSLADMLLQPRHMQEKWYNFLREASGEEAAEKFKYLLHTTNQKGARISEKTIFESTTPQSCDSPSWFDSPTSQININKPVYMRENLMAEHCNGFGTVRLNNVQNGVGFAPNGFGAQPVAFGVQREHARPQVNGFGGSNVRCSESELQRHINEEFSNLSLNGQVNDVFRAFTDKEAAAPANGVRVNKRKNVGPRFYKFFQ